MDIKNKDIIACEKYISKMRSTELIPSSSFLVILMRHILRLIQYH